MATGFLKTVVQFSSALCAVLAAVSVGHGATFANTPAAVSNTYAGTITLQIGGLTNTETVIIRKYLDLNTNGVIDAGDYLVQQFNVTDSTNSVIGGVTNFNVPGDLNSATDTITATLNFKNGDFTQNIIGQYLYKLSSPSGRFQPLTNVFSVTNFPFAQKFTGNVVSNSTSTTLSNAVVLLFPAPRGGDHGPGTPVAGAVANSAGGYTIAAPPGTYVPMAFRSNYVANYKASPVLTLGSSQTISTNLSLTVATTTISGRIVDSTNTSLGLPGIFEPTTTTNGLIAAGFTDSNGNFSIGVTSGTWSIGSDDSGLIVHGYVGYQDGTNVPAGTSGIVGPFYQATALFYGSVKDSLGNPLAGIDISAQDQNNNQYQSDAYTDANGNYVVGVVGGLGSGDPWSVQVDTGGGGNPTSYVFSQSAAQQNGGTNLAAGQAILQNFTALLATNHITGNVKAGGTNIVGVQVGANANIGTNFYQAQSTTDTNGNFSLNVPNGNWSVFVTWCCDNDSLDGILGSGSYQGPANQNINITNSNGVVNFAVQLCDNVQIITTSLTNGQIGAYYSAQLLASSCDNNFNWSLASGTLPPGLTLYAGGPLNGTPTTNGTFNFTVRVVDGHSHTNTQALSLVIARPDVLTYYLTKEQNYYQADAATLIPDTTYGPFNAYLGIVQSALGSVTNANVTLPTSAGRGFPAGNTAIELKIRETFVNQTAFDSTYPLGNYTFNIFTPANGNHFPVLNLPLFSYPGAPHISNFAAAQNLNPNNAFLLQWDAFNGGINTNGTIWFFITDTNGTQVFSTPNPAIDSLGTLKETATATTIPAGTLQFGRTYFGVLTFFKGLNNNTTDYPGAFGVTLASASTTFAIKTISTTPALGQPVRVSPTQIGLNFSGIPGSNYTILATTNLALPLSNWFTVLVTNLSTNSVFIQDNQATNKQRFYRIKAGP